MFKQCSQCKETWSSCNEFLSDPSLTLVGYQVSFDELESGLFIFNHSCKTSLGIPVRAFTHLHDSPIFKEKPLGTGGCPESCLQPYNLDPCPVRCECVYMREVLQIIKKWPKEGSV